ncbi:MAG: hypothetical protein Q4B88_00660 [Moraxella sp.]|nr:hypothetical protein [Moraxella sp.]
MMDLFKNRWLCLAAGKVADGQILSSFNFKITKTVHPEPIEG